jgi:hypothetical protein
MTHVGNLRTGAVPAPSPKPGIDFDMVKPIRVPFALGPLLPSRPLDAAHGLFTLARFWPRLSSNLNGIISCPIRAPED